MQRIKAFLPDKQLSQELKNIIEIEYISATKLITEDEYEYVYNKMRKKLEITECAQTRWVREMTKCYRALAEIAFDYKKGHRSISKSCMDCIIGALFYYINPYDIIPDCQENGYLDDYHVLYLCMCKIPRKELPIVQSYFDIYVE